MRSFIYFIKEAFKNSRKNFGTTFGAIITIFLSLLVIGLFMVGSIIVDRLVQGVENDINIQVYLSNDATDDDVAALRRYLESLPEVSVVTYVSKDEAWEKFIQMSGSSLADALDGNPLPASLTVELVDPEKVQEVVNQLILQPVFLQAIDDPDLPSDALRYGEHIINQLFTFANVVRLVCLVLVILLIFVALVFINNTIRLAVLARRKEIAIMRLVGASNSFIRGPFVMEGAIQALLGAGLAIIAIMLIERNILSQVTNMLSFLTFDSSSVAYWMVYTLLLGVGLIIGLFGSMWALRRYLKV